jgi:hypothetical protein
MNEHDEYLRERPDHDPIALRWVIAFLAVFWLTMVWLIAWVAG